MGPAAYTEGEQFQRERRTVFARTWLPFAASGQMPRPGDFVSHSFGGWPLFGIRGEDGMARAFHNVCQHQSMPVVEQPVGSCEALRCRYHGWTYDLEGEFREAPPRVASTEPAESLGLNPVRLVEAGGLCFVRVAAGNAPPAGINLSGMHFSAAVTTDIDANWKAAMEAFLGEEHRHFVWPLALIDPSQPGVSLVRQIVPRRFSRTRIVDLIFIEDGTATNNIIEAQRARAAMDKSAAEACQAARAAGNAPEPSGTVAEFLQRVAAACA